MSRDPWENARKGQLEKARDLEVVLAVNEDLGQCMDTGCTEPRCVIPGGSLSVLCEHHTREVLAGRAKAPPLRRNIDYQSSSRKTFLVDALSGKEEK